MFAMWQLVLGKCNINANVTLNLKKDVDFEKKCQCYVTTQWKVIYFNVWLTISLVERTP
jgi:hypothetical protein